MAFSYFVIPSSFQWHGSSLHPSHRMKRSLANSKPQPASFTSWAGKPILFFFTSLCYIDYFPLLSSFPSGPRNTSTSGIGLKARPFQQQLPVFLEQVWPDPGSDPPFPVPGIKFWLVESLACFGLWILRKWAVFFSFIKAPGCHSGFFLFFELSTNTPLSGFFGTLVAKGCDPHFLTVTGLETPLPPSDLFQLHAKIISLNWNCCFCMWLI